MYLRSRQQHDPPRFGFSAGKLLQAVMLTPMTAAGLQRDPSKVRLEENAGVLLAECS
jgi:hypothetical protein